MKNKILLSLLSCSLAGFSHAAVQGFLGPTSTGEVFLSVNLLAPLEPQIEITGLEDFNWGDVTEDVVDLPPITINNICVRLVNAATYSISIEDISGFGGFEMTAGFSTIFYDVTYADAFGTSVGTSGGSGLRGSTAATCSAGELASLTIDPLGTGIIDSGNPFENVLYSGGLTLTVSPD